MPLFWVASYSHGLRRRHICDDGQPKQVRMLLPTDKYLLQVLRSCGPEGISLAEDVHRRGLHFESHRIAKNSIRVHGVVEARAGQAISDLLAVRTPQEQIYRLYEKCAEDLASLRIERSCWFREAIDLFTKSSGQPISTRFCFFTSTDISGTCELVEHDSISALLEAWSLEGVATAKIPCILMVDVLVFLAKLGKWQTLCLRRSRILPKKENKLRALRSKLVGCRDQITAVIDLLSKTESAPVAAGFIAADKELDLTAIGRIASRIDGAELDMKPMFLSGLPKIPNRENQKFKKHCFRVF